MLGMMAEPVEDELVYSALARTRRMLGVRHARFMAATLGSSGSGFCAIMPAGLAGLCAGNGAEIGLRLARQHTNLDHHGRWLTDPARSVLESYVTRGQPSAAWRLALPLPGSLVGPSPALLSGLRRRRGTPPWLGSLASAPPASGCASLQQTPCLAAHLSARGVPPGTSGRVRAQSTARHLAARAGSRHRDSPAARLVRRAIAGLSRSATGSRGGETPVPAAT